MAQWQLSHGKQNRKYHSSRLVSLTTLFSLEQSFSLWVSQGIALVALAFFSQDICVYPGAGRQPTPALGSTQICLLATKECLASLGFHELHFLV